MTWSSAFRADAFYEMTFWVVTTTADHGDGSCSFGDCTLREAVHTANAQAATAAAAGFLELPHQRETSPEVC